MDRTGKHGQRKAKEKDSLTEFCVERTYLSLCTLFLYQLFRRVSTLLCNSHLDPTSSPPSCSWLGKQSEPTALGCRHPLLLSKPSLDAARVSAAAVWPGGAGGVAAASAGVVVLIPFSLQLSISDAVALGLDCPWAGVNELYQ